MRKTAAILALLLAVAARPAAGAERVVLENGLTVILAPRHGAPVASVGVFVRVGRIDEPPSLAGATHFVEHMMFRATGRRPGGGSEREAWATGARMEARTEEDFTRYLVTLPSERVSLAFDLLSDALTSAKFLPDEVEEERRVVLAEIEKRHAEPDTRAWEDSTALAFLPHPYGERIIGSRESIGSMGRDALYGWFRRRYRPDRTVLVVVGDVGREEALAAAREHFGRWKAEGPPPPAPLPLPERTGGYQESVTPIPGASPALYLTAPMPAYLDPDYLPARFLVLTLSGRVRERLVAADGPAEATDVWFTPYLGTNLLRIRATLTSPESAAEARDRLLHLLREVREPGFFHGGLRELASNFAARELLAKEDLATWADLIGRAALAGYYDPPGPPEALAAEDRYSRVGEEDLSRVARRALVPGNLRILWRLPPGSPPPPPPDAAAVAGEGRRFPSPRDVPRRPVADERPNARRRAAPRRDSDAVATELSSGLTLVHLEDDSLPLVGISLVFPRGSRLDPDGLEGLATVAIEALPRATVGYEQTDLRWRLFALGNDYRFTADPDATRITLTVPSEDLSAALETIATMVRRPAFTPEAIREARGRVLRRARAERETVSSFAGLRFRQLLLPDTGYAHSPLGGPDSLLRIRREDVVAWHREHLGLDGAWLALVGDISPRRARGLAESIFGGERRPAAEVPPPGGGPAPPPAEAVLDHPSGRSYVIVGARGPARFTPDVPALALLQQVLGWIVFHEFTDVRSTAYEAGAWHDSFAGAGIFGAYVGTRSGETEEVAGWLASRFAALSDPGPDPALVEDARRAWLGGAALASQELGRVSARIAWRGAVGGASGSWDNLTRAVGAATPAELAAAAKRYLAPGRLSVLRVR